MKRIIATILTLVVMLTCVLGTLTSCGGNKTYADFEMPEGGFNTEEEIEITFYHTMGAALTGILTTAIEEFNALYPNITVKHESYGNYDALLTQIRTEITVGNQPNLAYCYPDHVATYNEAGAVQTLDTLINSDLIVTRADGTTETIGYTEEQIADFIEAYYQEGLSFGDGKMYSVALAKSTEVLYYNKTFFDEHDLTVPTTWEEMAAVCEQIKAIEPSCIPLGYDSESNWFITLCEQYGSPYTSATGENYLFDNTTNHTFMKTLREWYQKRWITTEELSGGYTSSLFTGDSANATEGSEAAKGTRCYMCIGSTGGATYQQPKITNGVAEFEVGIAAIPQVDKDAPKVISQGPSLCVFKRDNPQEVLASWLFAKFLTTNVEYQARVSMNNGYVPVMKSVQENEIYADFIASADENPTLNITAYAAKVAIENAEYCYTSPAFYGSSVARIQVGLLLQKCLSTSTTDVDAMIKKAFEDCVAECKYQSGQ